VGFGNSGLVSATGAWIDKTQQLSSSQFAQLYDDDAQPS
jgi:hypothetical protein